MARSIRIEIAGALYHVLARGNRRESIYRDDDDRRFFLKTLAEACEMTGWRVHAWVLMGNHYHLLIQTPEPNLVVGMKWLQNTYTRRFNIRHRLWGRLFGDRYKAMPVENEGYYYETLVDYIHLNPARRTDPAASRRERDRLPLEQRRWRLRPAAPQQTPVAGCRRSTASLWLPGFRAGTPQMGAAAGPARPGRGSRALRGANARPGGRWAAQPIEAWLVLGQPGVCRADVGPG